MSCYQCSRSAGQALGRILSWTRPASVHVPPFGFSSPIICAASGCFPAHRHRHKEIIQNHRLTFDFFFSRTNERNFTPHHKRERTNRQINSPARHQPAQICRPPVKHIATYIVQDVPEFELLCWLDTNPAFSQASKQDSYRRVDTIRRAQCSAVQCSAVH